MSETNNRSTNLGIGVVILLGVLFVGLKLAGVIDWSWWWITAVPFWSGAVLIILIAYQFIAFISWLKR